MNQLKAAISDLKINDPENISSSKYHDIVEIHNVGIPNKISLCPCSL